MIRTNQSQALACDHKERMVRQVGAGVHQVAKGDQPDKEHMQKHRDVKEDLVPRELQYRAFGA